MGWGGGRTGVERGEVKGNRELSQSLLFFFKAEIEQLDRSSTLGYPLWVLSSGLLPKGCQSWNVVCRQQADAREDVADRAGAGLESTPCPLPYFSL